MLRFVSLVLTLRTFPTCTLSFGFQASSSSSPARSFSTLIATAQQDSTEYYRWDGVRITHDPFAPGLAEKYGLPGETDPEGFVSTS